MWPQIASLKQTRKRRGAHILELIVSTAHILRYKHETRLIRSLVECWGKTVVRENVNVFERQWIYHTQRFMNSEKNFNFFFNVALQTQMGITEKSLNCENKTRYELNLEERVERRNTTSIPDSRQTFGALFYFRPEFHRSNVGSPRFHSPIFRQKKRSTNLSSIVRIVTIRSSRGHVITTTYLRELAWGIRPWRWHKTIQKLVECPWWSCEVKLRVPFNNLVVFCRKLFGERSREFRRWVHCRCRFWRNFTLNEKGEQSRRDRSATGVSIAREFTEYTIGSWRQELSSWKPTQVD